ncbi:hypothetical protein SASPL_133744 [Salvia splendens]|uniref:Uncharacterized protein n=1 Tax=Salvia splendens TaxID=180675 RepID=A0A8X8X5K5_SALSN|nr:hypothetical protein SASPL_133744 [Salvia splendens]
MDLGFVSRSEMRSSKEWAVNKAASFGAKSRGSLAAIKQTDGAGAGWRLNSELEQLVERWGSDNGVDSHSGGGAGMVEIACKPCLEKGLAREAIDRNLNPDYDPDDDIDTTAAVRAPLNPDYAEAAAASSTVVKAV